MSETTTPPKTAIYAELLHRRLDEITFGEMRMLLIRACEQLWPGGDTETPWTPDTTQNLADDLGDFRPDSLAQRYGVTLLPSERCDECSAEVPDVDGGELANRHHDEACSLYDQEQE